MKNFSNEVQIEIDDVYGCPGHCPGCVLSSLEKKSIQPDMKFELIEFSINKLINHVNGLKNIEKINLTYGIADHFLMSDDYLNKIYQLGADLIEKTNLKNQYNGVFLTASMIGKNNIILNKIENLMNKSKNRGVPLYIIAVLDPKHLYNKNFVNVYKNNIIKAHELTGKIDLSINLSEEAINNISAKELYDFAKINNFDEVTINWTPTKDNIKYVYFEEDKLLKWLIDFDKLIDKDKHMTTSYRTIILKTLNQIMCKNLLNSSKNNFFDINNYPYSLQQSVENQLNELLLKSIHIDHLGNIFPKYEAIGDISHSPRNGFKEWGNVKEDVEIFTMFERNKLETKKNIIKNISNEVCVNCNYNLICANTGFHIYNKILNENKENIKENLLKYKNENCFHVGKKLIEYYIKNYILNN